MKQIDNSTLAARLASCFDKSQGRTQAALSRFCGVSTAAVAQWVRSGGISEENLRKAADFFNVDEAWLRDGGTGRKAAEVPPDAPAVPGCVAVHVCEPAIVGEGGDRRVEWRRVPGVPSVLRPQEFFRLHGVNPARCRAMRIRGDAMAPSMLPGDRVVLEEFSGAEEARAAVVDGLPCVILVDGICRVKRLGIVRDGLRLLSDNVLYPPEDWSGADLGRIRLCGRVIGLERDLPAF